MSATPEDTGKERDYEVGYGKPPVHTQFKPGNPGRPKGSRNKLSEDFFKVLAAKFEERGEAAVSAMIDERPHEFAKMIAGLQSKEFTGEDGGDIPIASKIILEGVSSDDSNPKDT